MRCLKLLQILKLNPLILILLFTYSVASQAAELFLKERAQVEGSKVFLKDVAKIEGSPLEKEILSKIPVSAAPSPCSRKSLTKREVAAKVASYLKRNKVSFKEIKVKGAERVEIYRGCTVIGGERIKKLIESYLESNYPDVVLISAPTPQVRLAESSFKESIKLESMGRHYGRFVYTVTSPDGRVLKRLYIPVRIDRKVKVVKARLSIPRGAVITREMVEASVAPSAKARGALPSVKDVIGKVARRDILPGEVIKERDVSPNFIVKKGKPVKVVYDKNGIHVELLGVPVEDGAVGNIIKVKNLSTGKILRCRVERDGSVRFVSE